MQIHAEIGILLLAYSSQVIMTVNKIYLLLHTVLIKVFRINLLPTIHSFTLFKMLTIYK